MTTSRKPLSFRMATTSARTNCKDIIKESPQLLKRSKPYFTAQKPVKKKKKVVKKEQEGWN